MAGDQHALLRSLRRAGDEVQLTKVIGRLAQADQVFASGFLRAIVEHAPNRSGG